jgi:hypothetical protein
MKMVHQFLELKQKRNTSHVRFHSMKKNTTQGTVKDEENTRITVPEDSVWERSERRCLKHLTWKDTLITNRVGTIVHEWHIRTGATSIRDILTWYTPVHGTNVIVGVHVGGSGRCKADGRRGALGDSLAINQYTHTTQPDHPMAP